MILRCVPDEVPEATVRAPGATAAATASPGASFPETVDDVDRPCDAARAAPDTPSTCPVDVISTAGPQTRWAASVLDDDGVPDEPPDSPSSVGGRSASRQL